MAKGLPFSISGNIKIIIELVEDGASITVVSHTFLISQSTVSSIWKSCSHIKKKNCKGTGSKKVKSSHCINTQDSLLERFKVQCH